MAVKKSTAPKGGAKTKVAAKKAAPKAKAAPKTEARAAAAYARQERLDESQAEFEAVLRIDPKSSMARQAIDAIVARRKATGK